MTSSSKLRVGVVGCGRMGRLHARVYSEMPDVELVGVYDVLPDVTRRTAEVHGGRPFDSLEALADNVDAVSIASPTSAHEDAAGAFIRRSIPCLIEKPLAVDTATARRIAQLAAEHKCIVQVGHIERFNPAVRAMTDIGIKPRFLEVDRVSPFSFRSIDVGVVLDMMIHDIDIILRLADSEVTDVSATGVAVIGDGEDVCNARITFANGCVANLTASRLALKTERKLRVFAQDAYVSLDYQKKYGIVVKKAGNLDTLKQVVDDVRSGKITDLGDVDYTELVDIQQLQISDVEPLRAQLESFLNAVRTGSKPEVTAEDGLAAVQVAERIVAAMPAAKVE
ncbi:MAG: Gfo/Idh/MocA family protein [Phycisphaerae bacterium]